MRDAFVPPPYPYDRLSGLLEAANRLDGGVVDLSIGTPCDPPPAFVVEAMATSDTERGYPTYACLLYTSPSPRDISGSRMPSSA